MAPHRFAPALARATVLALALTIAVCAFAACARGEVLREFHTPTGVGTLERAAEGFLVLRMQGSWYDMGRQHGTLLKEEANAARDALVSTARRATFLPFPLVKWHVRRTVAAKQRRYIPKEYLEEMRGLADAAGTSFDEVQLFHSFTYLSTNCTVAAAWGRATADGELIFIRSNDSFLTVDYEKHRTIHPMLFVYRPLDGVPFMMVSWPGFIGASDGMNARRIAVANTTKRSKKKTPAGIPMIFRLKQVLAKAKTLDEAQEWLTARPFEGGYNFVLADGRSRNARVVQMDAATLYVGDWDGPAESNQYTYRGRKYVYSPTPDLLLRTNHPLSRELIANHADIIDANGRGDCLSGSRYRLFKERLAARHGTLTDAMAMDLLRDGYLSMYQGPDDKCMPVVTHQAVFTPGAGRVLLAVSSGHAAGKAGPYQASAYNHPWRAFDLSEWLNEVKP